MKQVLFLVAAIAFSICGYSQGIYTPVNPTTYGNHTLRNKADSAQHIPEKEDTTVNTGDTSAQIFVRKIDGKVWGYTKARRFFLVEEGGGGGSLTYPYSALNYLNGYGNWVNIRDTMRASVSNGYNMLYSAGVFTPDTTTGGTKLATQGDIDRAIAGNVPTIDQVLASGSTTTTNRGLTLGSNQFGINGTSSWGLALFSGVQTTIYGNNEANKIQMGALGGNVTITSANDVIISPLVGTGTRLVTATSTGVLGSTPTSTFLTSVPTLQQVTTAGNASTNTITVNQVNSSNAKRVELNAFALSGYAALAIQNKNGSLYVQDSSGNTTSYEMERIRNKFNNTLWLPDGTGTDTLATLSDVRAGGGGAVSLASVGGGLDIQNGGAGNIRTLNTGEFDVSTNLISLKTGGVAGSKLATTIFYLPEEFTSSTSLSITIAHTPITGSDTYYLNGVLIQQSNVSRTGTGVTFTGFTRETSDTITAKYSY